MLLFTVLGLDWACIPELALVPDIHSSSTLLSWPQGSEFMDSYMEDLARHEPGAISCATAWQSQGQVHTGAMLSCSFIHSPTHSFHTFPVGAFAPVCSFFPTHRSLLWNYLQSHFGTALQMCSPHLPTFEFPSKPVWYTWSVPAVCTVTATWLFAFLGGATGDSLSANLVGTVVPRLTEPPNHRYIFNPSPRGLGVGYLLRFDDKTTLTSFWHCSEHK
jgi:hypothetical protein